MAADAFTRELYLNIHQYFKDNNLSKLADNRMRVKVIGSAIWWLGTLVLLFTLDLPLWGFAALYLIHTFSQIYIGLNIGHDANHYAIFKNKRLSKALEYSYDLVGMNARMWRQLHDVEHHNVMNIQGEDENMVARGLLRYSLFRKWRTHYKYQHLYVYLLYMVFTTDWAFTKDFECYFFPYTNRMKKMKHSWKDYLSLFFWKAFYVTYMIVIPVAILGIPFWTVFALFLVGHAINGAFGASIIQTSHSVEGTDHPASRKEYDHHVYHIFATTTDYGVDSKFLFWFSGGLHLHVIHHLCPNVCHTHYPELTKIVKATAEKHGVPYHVNPSFISAIRSHLAFLKEMGSKKNQLTLSQTA